MTGTLNALLGVALVTVTMPAATLARTDPLSDSIPDLTSEHATSEFPPIRIVDRADLAPLPPFAARPFAISWVTIRTLAWAELPLNGRAILGLKFGAGADSDGIVPKVIGGRRV